MFRRIVQKLTWKEHLWGGERKANKHFSTKARMNFSYSFEAFYPPEINNHSGYEAIKLIILWTKTRLYYNIMKWPTSAWSSESVELKYVGSLSSSSYTDALSDALSSVGGDGPHWPLCSR